MWAFFQEQEDWMINARKLFVWQLWIEVSLYIPPLGLDCMSMWIDGSLLEISSFFHWAHMKVNQGAQLMI